MIALLAFCLPSLAATLSVGSGGDYDRVQDAVNDASDGDRVLIAAGTFRECVDLGGKDLDLEGAGSGETVLDGGGACAVALRLGSAEVANITGLTVQNTGYRAVELADALVTLEDVEITGSGNRTDSGGGVYIDGGQVSFQSCTLSGNSGAYGGNLFVTGAADVTLTGSTVSRGLATVGGGLYVDDAADATTTLDLFDSVITGNEATERGGGAYLGAYVTARSQGNTWSDNTGAVVVGAGLYLAANVDLSSVDDVFTDNTVTASILSSAGGGAMYLEGDDHVSLEGASFVSNMARRGGAICVAGYSELTVSDSAFTSNSADSSGGAIHAASHTELTVTGSEFASNRVGDGTGGALYQEDSGSLQITGVTFSANSSSTLGGAVYLRAKVSVSIADSVFVDNTSGDGGALVAEDEVPLSVADTRFEGNSVWEVGGAIYLSSLTYTTTLDRVSFEGNSADKDSGGAIFVSPTSPLQITASSFVSNAAYNDGGAIYTWSELDIEDTTFEENTASVGAAIRSYPPGASALTFALREASFRSNVASGSGGALYLEGFTVDIDDCEFDSNLSGSGGGALNVKEGGGLDVHGCSFYFNEAKRGGAAYVTSPAIKTGAASSWTNNVFVENEASISGGAIYLYDGRSNLAMTNNTFVGNGAATSGGALYIYRSGSSFVNNVFGWTSSGGAVYGSDRTSGRDCSFEYNDWYGNSSSDVGGSFSFSTSTLGNLTEAPDLVAYTLDGDADNDDLTLAAGSALIDAGDPSLLDPDGTVSDIGAYGGPEAEILDSDRDGSASDEDCDDRDEVTFPGADERCDAVDNDCDGLIDEDFTEVGASWYEDADGDGHGDPTTETISCEPVEGAVEDGSDCDDGDAAVYPGAAESAGDGVDQDCDGVEVCALDADGDGFRPDAGGVVSSADLDCTDAGEASGDAPEGDCDDGDAAVSPAGVEVCDGIDNNCDGAADEAGAEDEGAWYEDADGDGFGDPETAGLGCEAPGGFVASGADCDDSDGAVYPGAAEIVGDGVDQDCDGEERCYTDSDGDGAGTAAELGSEDADCADAGEAIAAEAGTDCDDSAAEIHPGAPEVCDGLDDDCDGGVDLDAVDAPTWQADADADGYTDPAVTETACEAPDGFREASAEADCDDTDAAISPGATEIPGDGVDQDCDSADAVADSGGDSGADTDSASGSDSATDSGADPETPEDKPDEAGCGGCATAGHAAGAWPLLLAGLALALRRRAGPHSSAQAFSAQAKE